MPGRLWLVVDVPCLAYRAFYSTGGLSYAGSPTGATYGVLRDVLAFQTQFATSYMVFTFERGRNKRKDVYPNYKKNREWSGYAEKDQQARRELQQEIYALRDQYLPEIGFPNVFSQDGYESDDVIAAIVLHGLPAGDRALIISADSDLWQLLSLQVSQYNPTKKEAITVKLFRDRWGIEPPQWADVKALAGCATDNVKGVRGIGERRAADYLSGKLQKGELFERLQRSRKLWQDNLPLVQLPYEGTLVPQLSLDLPRPAGWRRVLDSLGIKTLGRDL
jgi:DNA polymerase-1